MAGARGCPALMRFGGWLCWGLDGAVRIPAQDEKGGLRFCLGGQHPDSPGGGVVGDFLVKRDCGAGGERRTITSCDSHK